MTDQTTFREGLLDPTRATPDGLEDPQGRSAGKRYDVYRNNVTHALISALQTAFPLVRKIIGPQSFDTLAPSYVRRHPPKSPLMMHYGADFPDFLRGVRQLAHLGYLPDCARLDLAMRASYHAADAPSFDLTAFQALPPDAMMNRRILLAPATMLLRSQWPLFDIWAFNMTPAAAKPQAIAQDVLVTRPQFDPAPFLLPQGGGVWIAALSNGETLGAACDLALAETPDFDLAAALALVLGNGAFCSKKGAQDV